ncbi:NAD-dependent deacetylase hst3 [Sporothrix stenoceras]|uniref:NAD-dependent deacetylase hst3 n=1 Tax=Sporothrix stenoceras TaxID=5173 RepID=A0ABR3ZAP2_9PEZI
MPTSHVLPESAELLQEIADALWKAKKVLVVTGAGISTNSGIPDFRSKNGLYSLIQAQFDAAAKEYTEPEVEENESDEPEPISKRQRLSEERQQSNVKVEPTTPTETPDAFTTAVTTRRRGRPRGRKSHNASAPKEETIHCASKDSTDGDEDSIVVQLPALDPKKFAQSLMTPQRRGHSRRSAVGDSIECIGSLPQSSSPLSSPPSILFDPSEEYRSGLGGSARSSSSNSSMSASTCSSDAESDSEETPSFSQPTLSSQSSFASNKSTLPVMKGRDLFDASIWADPVKTSVFYTFATTLRQKVREVVPTKSHEFISHLRNTNKLVRCYTQNIDEIEEKVGLSTSLGLGPGKKGRFSTRSARASTGSVIAGKDVNSQDSQSEGKEQDPQELSSSQDSHLSDHLSASQQSQTDLKVSAKNRDPCFRGVECVFLHGSLRLLRCFRCGQTTPWDEAGRELETMSGRQPSCPSCAGATAAREGRGKRALAVGKLRPDIVLYGEEHPNAHLISPIVQHDISLTPDMLLILGTSLKVHGLKVLVREFAKAVHSRGGKVVFVNFTKPPESVWSDVIDYWVQWDCDTWVDDLKQKKPIMWLPPGSGIEEPKKKRKSISAGATKSKQNSEGVKPEDSSDTATTSDGHQKPDQESEGAEAPKEKKRRGRRPREEKEKESGPESTLEASQELMQPTDVAAQPEAAREAALEATKEAPPKKPRKRASKADAKPPVAIQDDQTNGAITVFKIMEKLGELSGRTEEGLPAKPKRVPTKRKPRQRHSALGELEVIISTQPPADTLAAPSEQSMAPPTSLLFALTPAAVQAAPLPETRATQHTMPLADISTNILPSLAPRPQTGPDKYSILSAVKKNPRRRQSKKIFEGGSGGPGGPLLTEVQTTTPKQQQQQRKQVKPRGRSKSMGVPAYLAPLDQPATPISNTSSLDTAWSTTDQLAKKLMMELSASSTPSFAAPAAPPNFSSPVPVHLDGTIPPPSHAVDQTPLPITNSEAPALRPSPNTMVLPPIRKMFPELEPKWSPENSNTFFFQDPLGARYAYPPTRPQSEWSCNDQLVRESDEQLKAVVDIRRQRQ